MEQKTILAVPLTGSSLSTSRILVRLQFSKTAVDIQVTEGELAYQSTCT